MPINISENELEEKVAWLCDDDWGLPPQIYEHEQWLKTNISTLSKSEYIADIGYRTNKDASGGGGVITTNLMQLSASIGMEIWLSEYPA